MIPKNIYDKDFNSDCIGYATHEDIKQLLKLDKGTVFIPDSGGLKFIPVARQTRLNLITCDDPKQKYKDYVTNTPQPNKDRLAFIKEQRDKYNYQDLGIHPLAVIGEDGMGYEWLDGWVEFPQVGGVKIGDNVRVGAFTTIKKGTIHDTVIGDGCKIGSHCNIGHNVKLGNNCLLTHRVSIAGSCIIGNNVFFGQGCIIKNKIKIGSNVVIGQGANVLVDVPDNTKVVGVWK